MAVETSTPVPDELDARVEQMLQHMDRVHAEVVNRLDPSTDDRVPDRPPPANLDNEVARALDQAAEAAKVTSDKAESQAAAATDEINGAVVPTATIKELDETLASAVPATVDDEFADGTQMVEGQSLDVPLPDSSPLGELPAVQAPEVVVAAAAPVQVPEPEGSAPVAAPTPAPTPAPAPAPAPVAKAAPAPAPVAKVAPTPPAPAPSKPATPAVIVPAKPAGPTWQDRFWTVATPVMEPIAVRLGKLPVGFQHTVGWIGIVTLFMAAATWGYVLCFQETRPASQIIEQQEKARAAEAEKGGSEHDDKKQVEPESRKSGESEQKEPAGEKSHGEEHSASHGAEENTSGGNEPG